MAKDEMGLPYHHFMGTLRDLYLPLKDILNAMKIRDSDVIADIGAGDGYFSALFAQHCKKVYAIDVNKAASDLIAAKNLKGVVAINADICQTWPVKDVSYAFFSNSFHDLPCKNNVVTVMKDKLISPARVAFIEFKFNTPFGPPPSIRLTPDKLDATMAAGGFSRIGHGDFRYHYISVYSKVK